jgi:hypothetical protein
MTRSRGRAGGVHRKGLGVPAELLGKGCRDTGGEFVSKPQEDIWTTVVRGLR